MRSSSKRRRLNERETGRKEEEEVKDGNEVSTPAVDSGGSRNRRTQIVRERIAADGDSRSGRRDESKAREINLTFQEPRYAYSIKVVRLREGEVAGFEIRKSTRSSVVTVHNLVHGSSAHVAGIENEDEVIMIGGHGCYEMRVGDMREMLARVRPLVCHVKSKRRIGEDVRRNDEENTSTGSVFSHASNVQVGQVQTYGQTTAPSLSASLIPATTVATYISMLGIIQTMMATRSHGAAVAEVFLSEITQQQHLLRQEQIRPLSNEVRTSIGQHHRNGERHQQDQMDVRRAPDAASAASTRARGKRTRRNCSS